MLLLRVTAFREIRSGVTAFLIARIALTGGGTLHDDGTFGLSERAESMTDTIRLSLGQHRRSMFDTASLMKAVFAGNLRAWLALFSRRQRLQLGMSDSNCAQTAEFLKIATTALVIDMAEAGFLRDAPRVRKPVGALKCISKDATLCARVALTSGGSMNALELQRWYLQRAERFVATGRGASPEARDAVVLWRTTLDDLARSPSRLVGQIDWVTKQALMTDAETLGPAARKKIDIKYHELGSGYFSLLEAQGLAPALVSVADVRDAIFRPPEDSPASRRGEAIRLAGSRRGDMRVSWQATTGPPMS